MNAVPYDIEIEGVVIGSMLSDPDCIADVVELVNLDDFYSGKYRKLYREIIRRWQDDIDTVNPVSMVGFFQKNGITVTEITRLISSIPTASTVAHYASKVADLGILRKLVEAGREASTLGDLRDKEEIREAVHRMEQKISSVSDQTIQVNTMKTMEDLLTEYAIEFEERYRKKEMVVGIPTGIRDIDRMTTGFRRQELIILAARPSMGKTAMLVDLTIRMARGQHKVLFFSLEMSNQQIMNRALANVANIDSQQLQTGIVSAEEYNKYTNAISELNSFKDNFVLDSTPSIRISEIKAKARRMKRNQGLDIIFIDYLGLIPGESGLSRYELVSENTRMLKNLAREMDCPVVCLCQLSRAVEQRQDKRPVLSDLRESGEIEQTADIVSFLYRDDYYNPDTKNQGISEFIIAKNRNGSIGSAEMLFFKEYSKFLPIKEETTR